MSQHLRASALKSEDRDGVDAGFGDVQVPAVRADRKGNGLDAFEMRVRATEHIEAHAVQFLVAAVLED